MKFKFLDEFNCRALLPKDEYNIVVRQLDLYLDDINNGGSGYHGLIDDLVKHNQKTSRKFSRLLLSNNLIDICLSIKSTSGNNKVETFNAVVPVLANEPCKFQLEFNNEKGTYWKIIIPLQYLLKKWGDAGKGYQAYHHTIVENIKSAVISKAPFGNFERYPTSDELAKIKQYTYFGITGRNWLQRLSEHLGEIKRGSNKTFHQAWRNFIGIKEVLYVSTLVEVNLTKDKVMQWEEWAVDAHGTTESPYILNMISGGYKGQRELYKLGLTKRENITLKERDKAIEELARKYTRKGIPAPWMTELWESYEYRLKINNAHPKRLSEEQVCSIRQLSKLGWPNDRISKEVNALDERQVNDVIKGNTYEWVKCD